MYVFDKEAIDDARLQLGLEWPVRVWWRQMYSAAGRYCHGYRGDHLITVSTKYRGFSYYPSEVIWHELGHARQHEQWGGAEPMMDEYYRQLDEAGIPHTALHYGNTKHDVSSIPMEQECYAIEQNAKTFPLMKYVDDISFREASLDITNMIESIKYGTN